MRNSREINPSTFSIQAFLSPAEDKLHTFLLPRESSFRSKETCVPLVKLIGRRIVEESWKIYLAEENWNEGVNLNFYHQFIEFHLVHGLLNCVNFRNVFISNVISGTRIY